MTFDIALNAALAVFHRFLYALTPQCIIDSGINKIPLHTNIFKSFIQLVQKLNAKFVALVAIKSMTSWQIGLRESIIVQPICSTVVTMRGHGCNSHEGPVRIGNFTHIELLCRCVQFHQFLCRKENLKLIIAHKIPNNLEVVRRRARV